MQTLPLTVNPRVSVIIPCYNQGAYLEEAIDSVLHSSYPDFEIIVVDDGSTDLLTKQLLEKMDKPHTTILRGPNLGVAQARNRAIDQSRGEYILPLDADDKISEHYLAQAVPILDARPDIGIVYAKARMFGKKRGAWRLPPYTFEGMLASNVIFCTSFFRKKDWAAVHGYKPQIPHGKEDWEFWLSLLETGIQVYQIPEVHFYYRIASVSRDIASNEAIKKKETNAMIYRLHKQLFDQYLPNPLQLYQESAYLKHLFGRLDYRLMRTLTAPIHALKRMLRIP